LIDLENSLIKETLQKYKSEVKLAVIFGSCSRDEHDVFSDLDILVVCNGEHEKHMIGRELRQLSFSLDKVIHPTLFTIDEFEYRLKHHDYLLVSLLDDSKFLYGDQHYYLDKTQIVMMDKIDDESLKFNKKMGIKTLDYANCCYRLSLCTSDWNSLKEGKNPLIKGIQNSHIALGYLLVSEEMKRSRIPMSLRSLMDLESGSQLKNLISKEKRIKRKLHFQI
jgi:predicted nucleotidyltransferase